jgi:hypothetical protein
MNTLVLCYLQRTSVEAERQRLSAIASNLHEQNIRQSERAGATESNNTSDRATVEEIRRAAASVLRKEVLAASRFTDPTGLNMQRAPSGNDLDNFEHDPELSILMMHAVFGNDFLLTPPSRNMTEAEEREYKDNLYEQCAVSEKARNVCISAYNKQMISERYDCNILSILL